MRVNDTAIEIRRYDNAYGYRTRAKAVIYQFWRIDELNDIHDLGFAKLGNELAGKVRVGLVRDRCAEVTHVGINRVAEQQHLHDRYADDHTEGQAIAAHLPDFLLGYSEQSGQ